MDNVELLILRLAMLGLLILFLAAVIAVISRDMRTPPSRRSRRVPGRATIQVVQPGRASIPAGAPIAIGSTRFTIGRIPGNSLVLDDDTVSSRHALIEANGRGWMLRDLGSTNGTYLNQQRVTSAVGLADGDEVTFGQVVTRFLAS